MNYRISIDRLVLDGLHVTRAHGPIVQAAVEAELSRLFSEGGLSPRLLTGGAFPSVPAETMSTTAGEPPASLGHRIARAVYGGIGK